jgi:hypothetical protein
MLPNVLHLFSLTSVTNDPSKLNDFFSKINPPPPKKKKIARILSVKKSEFYRLCAFKHSLTKGKNNNDKPKIWHF